MMLSRLKTYAAFVRISHSVFALPFALTGALLAWQHAPASARQLVWIVVAMVAARSAAMGFNRVVDAHYDRLNPRTSMRERATELVHIGQAVLSLNGTVEYFVNTVFNYPTLAECYKTAAFNGLNKLSRL